MPPDRMRRHSAERSGWPGAMRGRSSRYCVVTPQVCVSRRGRSCRRSRVSPATVWCHVPQNQPVQRRWRSRSAGQVGPPRGRRGGWQRWSSRLEPGSFYQLFVQVRRRRRTTRREKPRKACVVVVPAGAPRKACVVLRQRGAGVGAAEVTVRNHVGEAARPVVEARRECDSVARVQEGEVRHRGGAFTIRMGHAWFLAFHRLGASGRRWSACYSARAARGAPNGAGGTGNQTRVLLR